MNNLCIKSIVLFCLCLTNITAFSQENIDESLSPIRTRNIWYGDVHNAIGLQKGEGVVRSHNLLYGGFRYAISDDFSFGMKVSMSAFFNSFFTFFNENASTLSEHYAFPMSINMEYKGFSNSFISAAIGAELMGNNLSSYYRQITIGETPRVYLKSTIGNHKNNITLKGGMNISLIMLDDIPFRNSVNDVLWFGSIAGKCQLFNKIDFVGELNVDTYDRYFFFIEDEDFYSAFYYSYRFAVRAYFKERWSLDLGIKDGTPDLLAMPYLTLTLPLHFEEDE
ncbi:MAG: hypothetical protein AB8G11_13090 [Saprospiraceae bacterium]